ncbi:hypothetical protein ACIG8K_18980 [Streptomyces halstedii]|uniref:hypothetical protein n=1 Tax=Streptomyces halstedii TaxID=1944 RepID=UPI0037D0336D
MQHALIPSRPESTPLFGQHFRQPPARPAGTQPVDTSAVATQVEAILDGGAKRTVSIPGPDDPVIQSMQGDEPLP